MGFHPNNYRTIRQEYETKYLRAREDAERRRNEVETALPEVAALHRELSSVGLEIMRTSLQAKDEQARRAAIDALRQKNEALLHRRAELLLAAGYPADYTELRYECSQCSDTGYLDSGAMCSCMREKLITAGYASSGLGSLLSTQSFDNYSLDYFKSDEKTWRTMNTVLRTLRDYANSFSVEHVDRMPAAGNLLLVGGTGLGKTHLSTAVAKAVLDRGFDVLYTGAVGMVASFENARFGSSVGLADTSDIDRYYECDLLIIDDLGTEVSNQFTVSTIYNVINTRLNLRRPTVISTNLMQDELRRRYWDRITSRLFGEYQILLFLGTDVRAQKIKQATR